jgi:uncharacterized membrane protein
VPTLRVWLLHPVSDRAARPLCYLLGPLTGVLFLVSPLYSRLWAVRFHAFDSILNSGLWLATWGALKLVERWFPWFLQVLLGEIRFLVTMTFLILWIMLMISAYKGIRLAVPLVHSQAVRLARRYERLRPRRSLA